MLHKNSFLLRDKIAGIGGATADKIEGLGRFTGFCGATLLWAARWVGGFRRPRLLLPQLYEIGTRSIFVVGVVGAFVGAVLGVEAYSQFAAIGQQARLGGVVAISVLKNIGPVLAAVMIAGRVGSAVSAELGTMRVTEQLDALRAMGADPVAHLVVPRMTACLVMVPILTIFSDLVGIFGGWLVIVKGYGVDATAYWNFSRQFVGNWELFTGLFKSVMFGLAIGVISCYKGFYCESGAAGVGRAATDAFVTSFLAIIIFNFFLAIFFKNLYLFLFGHGGPTAFS